MPFANIYAVQMNRSALVIVSVGFALVSTGIPAEAGSLFPPEAVGQLPGIEASAIPLSDPVWVSERTTMRQVNPGTEEYYRIRIADRCHVENGVLVSSLCLDAEILQLLSSTKLVAREVVPGRYTGAPTGYVGYARGRLLAVAVPDAGSFRTGSVHRMQLRVDASNLVAETADGNVSAVLACRLVSSPSFEAYRSEIGTGFRTPVESPVVGLKAVAPELLPSSAGATPKSVPATARDRTRPARMFPSAALPADSTLVDRRMQELELRQDDIQDQVKRRNVVIESIEQARDQATNPEERAAMDDILKRARARTEMLERQLATASNEYRRIAGESQKADPQRP
jgi:hypothetical protein